MFCKSCGTALTDNPKFCTNCGAPTQEPTVEASNRPSVITASLENLKPINWQELASNRANIAAGVAFVSCFFTWYKANVMYANISLNFFNLASSLESAPGTILVSFIMYLFPLALLAFVFAEYIPKLESYKYPISFACVLLVVYLGVGLFQATHPSLPETTGDPNSLYNQGIAQAKVQMKDALHFGWGYYLALVATVVSFTLNKLNLR